MADDRFSNFYRVDFRAYAKVDGIKVPISFFNIGYRVDAIPDAYIEMALGREGVSGSISTAQGLVSKLKPFSTLEIYVNTTFEKGRAAASSPGLVSGIDIRVFDGYVHLPSYERSNSLSGGSQGLSLTGFGKMGGLAGTTQMVRGTVISAPSKGLGQISSRAGSGNVVTSNIFDSLLRKTIESDLWLSGIYPIMMSAAQTVSAWSEFKGNDFAVGALSRINKFKVFPEAVLNLSALAGSDVDGGFFRRSLAITLANTFYASWAADDKTGTLWDALVSLANVFYFHIVPGVEEDGVVPLVWNLGGEPYATLEASDYTQLSRKEMSDAGMYTYITQIGLKSRIFQTGEYQDQISRTQSLGYAGIPDGILGGQGQLRLVEAPAWILPTEASGNISINPGGELPDAAQPEALQAVIDKQGQFEGALISSMLGNGLAKQILHDNLFFHRKALLGGRFRLDIAPGSLLRVLTPAVFTSNDSDTFFAHVQETRLQGGTRGNDSFATTQFSLIGVRSGNEHKTISTKYVSKSPLYPTTSFRGAPLTTLG